ncbi:stalk domain-containing protein [Cohnella cellulosilytica]|uniref:Stalk domain-containing protein n=1 Tax=Cohnella cellulosilytica TaxID=986710 RepID=A0ABW2FNL2_9BACL
MPLLLRRSFTLITLAAALLAAVLPTAALSPASAASPEAYRIVVLGDSVSVGYEPIEEIKNGTAAPYGYADRLLEQSLFRTRSTLANYAILGLTAPGLANLLQGAADGKTLQAADLQNFSSFDPRVVAYADGVAGRTRELAADLAKADLVVLTIGGNDFSPLIKAAVEGQSAASASQIIQDGFGMRMNDYTEDLDKVMVGLHALAPDARIVMSDQYLPLFKGHELYPLLLDKVKELSKALDLFAESTNERGIPLKVAHVSGKFAGKESSYTYFNLFDNFDIHPKQPGYEAMAQAFAETIWDDGYRKPAPRAEEVPVSVVINGKEPPSKPTLIKGTTFLALRDVANAVGAELKWNQAKKTATFNKSGKEVVVTIGSNTVYVDGIARPLQNPAYFQKEGKDVKTYVPLAIVSDSLDYQVVFRKPIMTVFINS